jgi:1-aminocyclopropane-1-carboxylate deaminase
MIDETKIQLSPIHLPFQTSIKLFMLRLDLLDETISGNKWFKLKNNFETAKELGLRNILTFGGAFSNHIAATAKACKMAGFNAVGIIRGEEIMNPTLIEAEKNGMELKFVERGLYRDNAQLMTFLKTVYPLEKYLVIPEGGANTQGVEGCTEIIKYIKIPFDCVALSCGTGTTISGITKTLNEKQLALGFSALKGGGFLNEVVKAHLTNDQHHSFKIFENYHFGGYAKYTSELLSFMNEFKNTNGFELDFVYTAKMVFGLFDLIKQHYFAENTVIVVIHSGGLQGNQGINR